MKKWKEEVEGKVEGTHRSFKDSKEEVKGTTVKYEYRLKGAELISLEFYFSLYKLFENAGNDSP